MVKINIQGLEVETERYLKNRRKKLYTWLFVFLFNLFAMGLNIYLYLQYDNFLRAFCAGVTFGNCFWVCFIALFDYQDYKHEKYNL